jgi:hypothetical protein
MKTIKLLLLLLIIVGLLYLIVTNFDNYANYIPIPNRSLPSPTLTYTNCEDCNGDPRCKAYNMINDKKCVYTTTDITKDNLVFSKNENPVYVKICDPITYTLPPTTTINVPTISKDTNQVPKVPTESKGPISQDIDLGNYCSSNSYKLDSCSVLSNLCKQ